MALRNQTVSRKTLETEIELALILDGRGQADCHTGIGFFDHLLELLARHAGIDLTVRAHGDLEVDDHHLVEDTGIVLGQALLRALGEKKGIERYGSVLLPMDEVLVAVAIDLGGRFAYASDYAPQRERVGELSTEMVNHFFRSLAVEARLNLHFRFLSPGENEHHRIEAMFKGFARALKVAVRLDAARADELPTTKGVL